MNGWTAAFDAGRPDGRTCLHTDRIDPDVRPLTSGCAECEALDMTWVHLRTCLTCGHTGCCDSSRGKHAAAHAESAGHPVARSAEPGEDWAWCYEDDLFLEREPS
ncbi:Zn-finger in ubiquitin-hydrolases and other protein [Streptomyces sp. ADI96-02]|uniref:UBP-type zinc finger domain-containing protein n=1 Tax=Streptomyces sp. ADI96-02 TaxID=1522760 RepID=UPI000F550C22|nr:UBP-type zinc finger domain-containing protein [Streptomyces sp. ADI96-02]RPK54242.1 Zn-finger in ubiquitin-hydrolases and other protein [Streptomyces sp. ADI96-02]